MHPPRKMQVHNLTKSVIRVYPFTGLDWTDIFLVFTHVVVGSIDSWWLRAFREHAPDHINDEKEKWNKHKSSV